MLDVHLIILNLLIPPTSSLIVSVNSGGPGRSSLKVFCRIKEGGGYNSLYSLKVSEFDKTGWGDVSINLRRGFLASIPCGGRLNYHLFSVNGEGSGINLLRRSKWSLNRSGKYEVR